MNILKYSIPVFLIIYSSCKDSGPADHQTQPLHKNSNDSVEHDEGNDFYNSINQPEVEMPYVGHFRSKQSNDTLDFEIFPDSVNSSEFTGYVFIRGDKARISIDQTTSISVYSEGDIDGNGTEEIGLMSGWHTSSCRRYSLKTYSGNKWKEIANVETHLPDRAKGVDYYKKEGKQIRIISANGNACCQCFQLDTIYHKI
jgi:hypothetical protein